MTWEKRKPEIFITLEFSRSSSRNISGFTKTGVLNLSRVPSIIPLSGGNSSETPIFFGTKFVTNLPEKMSGDLSRFSEEIQPWDFSNRWLAKKIFFKGNKYSSFSLFKYDLITQRRYYGNIQLDWCSRGDTEFRTIIFAINKINYWNDISHLIIKYWLWKIALKTYAGWKIS